MNISTIIKFMNYQIRRSVYKLSYMALLRFNYLKVAKSYQFMKKNQFNSIDYNLIIQKENLYKIIDFAIKNISYYNRIAKQNNIIISKETIFKDIKKFPVLTKDIIRKNWKLLHCNLKNLKYRLNTSGGTTGEPILLIQDQNYILNGVAATIFFDEIGGYKLGNRLFVLWGNERDILKNSKGILNYYKNKFLKNTFYLNSFRMSDAIMHQYSNQINELKPKIIIAYVQSMYEMAKYTKKKKIEVYPPNSIIVTAGVLTKMVRNYLESVFNCKIFNRYGSREVGMIASSCEKSSKLHINMYQQYIEILDDNDNQLNENELGNIVITNLTNYGMPLIRYKIGDRGLLNLSHCTCGRGLIRLDSISGRSVDIFKNKKGEIIDGEYFTHLFYFRENIKKFQVIQEKMDEIDINIVTFEKKRLDSSIETELTKKIKIVMGNDCIVNFHYVSDIYPSKSGKFRYTISKLK